MWTGIRIYKSAIIRNYHLSCPRVFKNQKNSVSNVSFYNRCDILNMYARMIESMRDMSYDPIVSNMIVSTLYMSYINLFETSIECNM